MIGFLGIRWMLVNGDVVAVRFDANEGRVVLLTLSPIDAPIKDPRLYSRSHESRKKVWVDDRRVWKEGIGDFKFFYM